LYFWLSLELVLWYCNNFYSNSILFEVRNVVTSLLGLVIVSHLSPKGSRRFSGELVLDVFFLKILLHLQILELGPVVASYLFHLELKFVLSPSLESALGSLGFLIYPAKRTPK
jgi:hypothetical protein